MEIPREIRYEFFLIFSGLFLLVSPVWLYIYHSNIFSYLLSFSVFFIILLFLISFGIVLISYGFIELTENYFREKQLYIRKYILERYRLDTLVLELPSKYTKLFKNETLE